jgi:shikimate 5-dehydrogenase
MSHNKSQGYPQVVRLGLVGSGIGYSRSPMLHNGWLKQNNINGVYDLIDCSVFDRLKIQQLIDLGY